MEGCRPPLSLGRQLQHSLPLCHPLQHLGVVAASDPVDALDGTGLAAGGIDEDDTNDNDNNEDDNNEESNKEGDSEDDSKPDKQSVTVSEVEHLAVGMLDGCKDRVDAGLQAPGE